MATWKNTMLFGLTTRATTGNTAAGLDPVAGLVSQATATPRRTGGWSESVYENRDNPARDQFEELCKRRARLLPLGAAIIGQRYEGIVDARGSTTGGKIFVGASGLESDVPQMALLCRVPSLNSANISKLTLRGIPDVRVREGEYNPSIQFDRDLTNYFSWLSGYRFKARNLTSITIDIGGIDSGGLVTLAGNNPGFLVNNRVRVLRTMNNDDRQLGGAFRVTGVTSTTVQLANWANGECLGGRLRLEETIYADFDGANGSILRAVVRKVGRPFGGYVGRSSKRR